MKTLDDRHALRTMETKNEMFCNGHIIKYDNEELVYDVHVDTEVDNEHIDRRSSLLNYEGNIIIQQHDQEFLDELYDIYFHKLASVLDHPKYYNYDFEVTTYDLGSYMIAYNTIKRNEMCILFCINGDKNAVMYAKHSRLNYLELEKDKEYLFKFDAVDNIVVLGDRTFVVFIKLRKKDEREYGLRIDPCTRGK